MKHIAFIKDKYNKVVIFKYALLLEQHRTCISAPQYRTNVYTHACCVASCPVHAFSLHILMDTG